jgi:adenosylmethionine-8-amino-7-oxononanoate aminotransferase
MSNVMYRNLKADMPVITGGDGNWLIAKDGKRYLDACGGAAVSCLGHDDQRVREAIKRQVDRVAFVHSGSFTNEPAEELASWLVERLPAGSGNGRAMFLGSGSEAMEAALKLARQTHLERGQPERHNIIARHFSYHGNTLGALATGGHAGRRAPYDPILYKAHHIDPCYAYRHRKEGESEQDFGLRMANLLEERVLELGPETVAAFVAEPVVGATLGSQAAADGYFRRIREICDQYGVLFIADEVMCGMGRTGSLYAMEQEGVAADITICAKGLGAGYQPIAACIASEAICADILAGSGRLWNGHTYMSHAIACAGSLEVLKIVEEEGLLANVRRLSDDLEARLNDRFGQHAHVGDIRGRGLFWSIEIVKDRETREPFAASAGIAPKLQATAMESGMMCYPMQGCADGTNGDHVLLAPGYRTTDDEMDVIVDRLCASVESTLATAI